ncbi:MAG: VOC family protein [Nakamurella sp.]
MSKPVPFLTFQPAKGHSAESAMHFYVEKFDDSEVLFIHRRPEGSPGAGTVMLAEFSIGGAHIRCSDSFVEHEWDFTPATSMWLDCATEEEQQRLFTGLSQDGRVLMPLDDYGFGPFGWVDDRFGISWQLAIG